MIKLFAYKFLSDFWTIMPVLVPFYKANGMNAAQILITQAAYSLSQLVFEIPSGYLADIIGRRRTLILAALLLFTGVALYAFSNGFWLFIAAETVLGISGSLRSGTDSALLYDTLKEINDEKRYTFFEGRAEFWCRTGTAAASILGGLAGAAAALRLPFYINIVTSILLVIVGFSLREPARDSRPHGSALHNILRITVNALRHAKLRPVMLLSAIIGSTGITAIWGFFLFFGRTGLPLYWYGIIFAATQMASAFGARHAHETVARLGEKACFILLIVPGAVFLVFGICSTNLIIPLILAHAVIWGLSTPLLLERINQHTGSDVRATTLSVSSMIGRVLYIGGGPVFGLITDHRSVGLAFLCMAVGYLVTVPVLAILSLRR